MGVVIVEVEGAVLGVNLGRSGVTNGDGDALFPNYFGEDLLLAICRPSGCTVASGVIGVVVVIVVGVCNRSQMRTSKCTCLVFGLSSL